MRCFLHLAGIGAALFAATACPQTAGGAEPSIVLRYSTGSAPTSFPPVHLGTAWIGAAISGELNRTRFHLQNPTLWAGKPLAELQSQSRRDLVAIRSLLLAGKSEEAAQRALVHLQSRHRLLQAVPSVGELTLDYTPAARFGNYRSELDLATGVFTEAWREGDTRFRRSTFTPPFSGMMWIHWTCEGPGSISTTINLSPEPGGTTSYSGYYDPIVQGRVENPPADGSGNYYKTWAHLDLYGGSAVKMFRTRGGTRVENAVDLELCVSSGVGPDEETAHVESLRKIAMRMSPRTMRNLAARRPVIFHPDPPEPGDNDFLPVAERLQAVRRGAEDPGLAQLLYQYARYLDLTPTLYSDPPSKARE